MSRPENTLGSMAKKKDRGDKFMLDHFSFPCVYFFLTNVLNRVTFVQRFIQQKGESVVFEF